MRFALVWFNHGSAGVLCFFPAAHAHLVPVDVCEEQDSALWQTRFRRRGWRDRGFGNVGQSDVPRCINVELATGGAHQQRTGFTGPQQGLLQDPDEVVPEELSDLSTHRLIGQMETDARLANRVGHSLFVRITLIEITKQNQVKLDQTSDEALRRMMSKHQAS